MDSDAVWFQPVWFAIFASFTLPSAHFFDFFLNLKNVHPTVFCAPPYLMLKTYQRQLLDSDRVRSLEKLSFKYPPISWKNHELAHEIELHEIFANFSSWAQLFVSMSMIAWSRAFFWWNSGEFMSRCHDRQWLLNLASVLPGRFRNRGVYTEFMNFYIKLPGIGERVDEKSLKGVPFFSQYSYRGTSLIRNPPPP